MKKLIYSLAFVLIAFFTLYSCTAEEEDATPPPSVIQTPEPEPTAPTQYTLEVITGEGGTVSSEGGTYDEGTEVTITATPAEGYEFVGWEGSDSTNETLTITLNSNQTIQAQFELNSSSTINDFLESNVFASSDVNQQEKQVVINALETVMDIFEVDIPVEYYVLGEDIDAANELASVFCNRRLESNIDNWSFQELNADPYSQCLEFMMYPNQSEASVVGEFFNWADDDIKGEFEQARANEGPGAAWAQLVSEGTLGLVISGNSATQGITIGFESAAANFVFHEYFHIYQLHKNTLDIYDYGEEELKFIDASWFIEGGASFYADKLVRTKINSGFINESSEYDETLREQYSGTMEFIKNEITNGNLSQEDLDNFNYYKDKDWNIYGYSLGAWSVAYLNSIAANEYSLVDFYNKFPDLGSKEAFLTVYGISIEEFYTGFNAFLTKPINEQMEIIPDI